MISGNESHTRQVKFRDKLYQFEKRKISCPLLFLLSYFETWEDTSEAWKTLEMKSNTFWNETEPINFQSSTKRTTSPFQEIFYRFFFFFFDSFYFKSHLEAQIFIIWFPRKKQTNKQTYSSLRRLFSTPEICRIHSCAMCSPPWC